MAGGRPAGTEDHIATKKGRPDPGRPFLSLIDYCMRSISSLRREARDARASMASRDSSMALDVSVEMTLISSVARLTSSLVADCSSAAWQCYGPDPQTARRVPESLPWRCRNGWQARCFPPPRRQPLPWRSRCGAHPPECRSRPCRPAWWHPWSFPPASEPRRPRPQNRARPHRPGRPRWPR